MTATTYLHELLSCSARLRPQNTAVIDPGIASITYEALDACTDVIRDQLIAVGVESGDRIGLCAPKSIGSVAGIFGTLKAGAAYVPVDAGAPAARNAFIFQDCAVKAILLDKKLLNELQNEFPSGVLSVAAEFDVLREFGSDLLLVSVNEQAASSNAGASMELAYILYTSGSTGQPKGVMHSHSTALSFVDWCSEEIKPTEKDRFSSHAPFHFDLSILDIYVPLKHQAAVILIGEAPGKQPLKLAELIAREQITVWYSTPSILRLLVDFGKMKAADYPKLRLVLFAGEVFPIKNYLALKEIWSRPRYYNLYGPTETNVCTYYEVAEDHAWEATETFPIGRKCSGDNTITADKHGKPLPPGQQGELYVSGGSVMLGYWNLPEQNELAFFTDESGTHWYKTGDIVQDDGDGSYLFFGRRDRMVKRRGYRVELGEIESALYTHPSVTEAAAIDLPDAESGVLIVAYLSWSSDEDPSILELKQHCARNLPAYMIPDRFRTVSALPKTSTDKIDYQKLRKL